MEDLDALRVRAASATARQFAEILVAQICLAAEMEPHMLRTALGQVFPLESLEERIGRLHLILSRVEADAHEALELLRNVYRGLDAIEKRIDLLEHRQDCLDIRKAV